MCLCCNSTASHPVPQNECMPTTASIANEVRLLAGYFKLKAVFVAVQKSHANLAFGTELLDSLRKQLGKDVTVLSPSFNVPWVDLNILGAAGEFCRIYYCDVLFLELCARAVVDVILDECQMRTPHTKHNKRVWSCRCFPRKLRLHVLSVRTSATYSHRKGTNESVPFLFLRSSAIAVGCKAIFTGESACRWTRRSVKC